MTVANGADGQQASPALTVVVVATEHDRSVTESITRFLDEAGWTIGRPTAVTTAVDAAVVVISAAAVSDGDWRTAVASLVVPRVVPIVVGQVDDELVPDSVKTLHWIQWKPDAFASTLGTLAGALQGNLDRYQRSRELARQAEAWGFASYSDDLLVTDRRRADEMANLVEELHSDPTSRPSELTEAFVQRSVRAAKRRWSRRLFKTIAGAVVIVVAVVAGLVVLAQLRNAGRTNHQALVTLGDRAIRQELPEWSGLLSASLIVNGTEQQQDLGRTTLRRALSSPWSLGGFDVGAGHSLEDMRPYAKRRRAALIIGRPDGRTELGIAAVRSGRVVRVEDLDGTYTRLDIADDERSAVVVGSDGVVTVDLATGRRRKVGPGLKPAEVQLSRFGDAAIELDGGTIVSVSLTRSYSPRTIDGLGAVLDLRRMNDGSVRALVSASPGSYRIIDASDGHELAAGSVPVPVIAAGGLLPDAPDAVVSGGDHQLWTIGPDGPPTPTGIAVPDLTNVVRGLSANRVVVGGQTERAHVIHVPTRADLGVVCREIPRVIAIQVDPRTDTLGCLGYQLDSVWVAPRGPRPADELQPSTSRRDTRRGYTVETRGGQVRVVRHVHGQTLHTDWLDVFVDDISSVAIAPNASRVLVTSTGADVAIIDITPPTIERVVTWHTPDGSPPIGATWAPGPVVVTAAGSAWDVPDCRRCGTDAGLIRTFRERDSGCWNTRQIMDIDADTRDTLGASECPANPLPEGA